MDDTFREGLLFTRPSMQGPITFGKTVMCKLPLMPVRINQRRSTDLIKTFKIIWIKLDIKRTEISFELIDIAAIDIDQKGKILLVQIVDFILLKKHFLS